MLIEQDRIPIGIDHRQTGRPGSRFVSFRDQGHTISFELFLQITDVGERL